MGEGIPGGWITDLFDFWVTGVVTQVANIPAGIRIERWLHRHFPELREAQDRSLAVQLREYRMAMAPQVREFAPPRVFLVSNAVHNAYAAGVGPLIDEPDAVRVYAGPEIRGLGDRLRAAPVPVRPGHQGHDREAAHRWARIVGIGNWHR